MDKRLAELAFLASTPTVETTGQFAEVYEQLLHDKDFWTCPERALRARNLLHMTTCAAYVLNEVDKAREQAQAGAG